MPGLHCTDTAIKNLNLLYLGMKKMPSETDVALKAISGLDWMDGLEISGRGSAKTTISAKNQQSHSKKLYLFFCFVLIGKILHFPDILQTLCNSIGRKRGGDWCRCIGSIGV